MVLLEVAELEMQMPPHSTHPHAARASHRSRICHMYHREAARSRIERCSAHAWLPTPPRASSKHSSTQHVRERQADAQPPRERGGARADLRAEVAFESPTKNVLPPRGGGVLPASVQDTRSRCSSSSSTRCARRVMLGRAHLLGARQVVVDIGADDRAARQRNLRPAMCA